MENALKRQLPSPVHITGCNSFGASPGYKVAATLSTENWLVGAKIYIGINCLQWKIKLFSYNSFTLVPSPCSSKELSPGQTETQVDASFQLASTCVSVWQWLAFFLATWNGVASLHKLLKRKPFECWFGHQRKSARKFNLHQLASPFGQGFMFIFLEDGTTLQNSTY